MKGRTQPTPASDHTSLTTSKYHTVPLGARRIYEAVHPPMYARDDLTADPIYYFHPSAREDLQSPFFMQFLNPSHNAVIIENYYITRIYSTDPQNDISFYALVYLHKDYN